MRLKYKNTIYEPKYELTKNKVGLKDDDFWVDIHFKLKNNEIDFEGIIPGVSFNELVLWNEMNKKMINGNIKENKKLTFIRKIGEMKYLPKESKVEKRLYLFDDVDKYYTIYFNLDEIKEIYEVNKKFIDEISNKKTV